MKAIEILKIGEELLKTMSKIDLHLKDYKFINLFEEYLQRRLDGEKVESILYNLSLKYNVSESTIKRLTKRLSREVRM